MQYHYQKLDTFPLSAVRCTVRCRSGTSYNTLYSISLDGTILIGPENPDTSVSPTDIVSSMEGQSDFSEAIWQGDLQIIILSDNQRCIFIA